MQFSLVYSFFVLCFLNINCNCSTVRGFCREELLKDEVHKYLPEVNNDPELLNDLPMMSIKHVSRKLSYDDIINNFAGYNNLRHTALCRDVGGSHTDLWCCPRCCWHDVLFWPALLIWIQKCHHVITADVSPLKGFQASHDRVVIDLQQW